MEKRIIAHIDMDCFFCACEIKRRPYLKGKPVIVGSTGNYGVVSAADYQARKYGVFSATPISKARRLCPDATYLAVDRNFYLSESKKIMKIFSAISDDMQQVSIDEAYLDLTTYSKDFISLEEMAKFIQKTVRQSTGLDCSIGISNSTIVSKIASDYKKPKGITIVYDAKEFLKDLPIETFPGIGKRSKHKYHKHNIFNIGDLAKINRFDVIDKFGMHAVKFHQVSLGKHLSKIKHRNASKSVSRENTFYDAPDDIENKLINLCKKVYDDLESYYFKTISIKVRLLDFTTMTRDLTLTTATKSLEIIKEKVLLLFSQFSSDNIRLVGVKLSNLACGLGMQTTLDRF